MRGSLQSSHDPVGNFDSGRGFFAGVPTIKVLPIWNQLSLNLIQNDDNELLLRQKFFISLMTDESWFHEVNSDLDDVLYILGVELPIPEISTPDQEIIFQSQHILTK